MILTHGINSLSKGLKGVLFFTKFENFDGTTKIDVPIVGPNCYYGPGQNVSSVINNTKSALSYNGKDYICLRSEATSVGGNIDQQLQSQVNYGPVIDMDGIVKYSVECIMKVNWERSDYSSFFAGCLRQDIFDFVLDPQFNTLNPGQFGPLVGDYPTLYGNVTQGGYSGGGYRQWVNIPVSLKNKSFHLARVVDRTINQGGIKTYLDGDLIAVGDTSNWYGRTRYIQPRGCSRVPRHIISYTALKVTDGDLSINDGANYPIP